jgi:oxaloacetate decarboxylase beta subunit
MHPIRKLATRVLLVIGVASAPLASASEPFGVRFTDHTYLRIPVSVDDGVRRPPQGPDETDREPSSGLLHDASGSPIGSFTVVWVDELDAVARVDRMADGRGVDDIHHASVPGAGLEFVIPRPDTDGRYVVLETGWRHGDTRLRHGAKGSLQVASGGVGALFTVVSVGPRESLGRISEYAVGVFNRDLVAGRLRGYVEQVIAGTGFANLTWPNLLMLVIGGVFIWLGIAKQYEPLLLVPIGFGMLIGNIPLPLQIFDAVSVYMIDPVTHEYTFNTSANSVLGLIYFGVRSGLLPPLIFLGIGTLTDFTALLSNPRAVLLGAAAQVGIFATFLGALELGFSPANAAAIGIIGGADGPTAIFLSSRLAPSLIGPIAIAAYSYMAMVPIIQPPIMKLLTTSAERRIRMHPGRKVARREKVLFPVAGMLVTTLVAPGGLPLLGMLFFGNLLKESGVTARLAKTAGSALLDIATILLGIGVGASTSAQVFLTRQSVLIFVLGCVAFAVATAGGVLFAKLMNAVSSVKINPLIGAAGVSAVPDSARVVHHVGQQADPTNYLLQHAMGPNVAGVIGSAIAAGVFLGIF